MYVNVFLNNDGLYERNFVEAPDDDHDQVTAWLEDGGYKVWREIAGPSVPLLRRLYPETGGQMCVAVRGRVMR
jgi:hypothetical protein